METADCVILAAGGFPRSEPALQALSRAKFVCCCDSAAEELLQSGIRLPDAIVGDGDSLPLSLQRKYSGIFHKVNEQDDNDLTKATRYCLSLGYNRIDYLGTTGRREDHTLGNIALLLHYHRMGIVGRFLTDYGIFFVADGNTRFSSFPGQQVSLFNVSSSRLEGKGLRWSPYPFNEFWQGTLNEATGEEVELLTDGLVLVYQTYQAKS